MVFYRSVVQGVVSQRFSLGFAFLVVCSFSFAERYVVVFDDSVVQKTATKVGAPARFVTAETVSKTMQSRAVELLAELDRRREVEPGLANRAALAKANQLVQAYDHAVAGFTATLTPEAVGYLRTRADIKYVEPVVEGEWGAIGEQALGAAGHWALDRIDQRDLPFDNLYQWDYDGEGVHAYIIDTGMRSTHDRLIDNARDGYNVRDQDFNTEDCYGHGTKVAGALGGLGVGTARSAALVPVRISDCAGSFNSSDFVAAAEWIIDNAQLPAVVNFSGAFLNGSVAVDDAVRSVVEAGITVVVSAGNSSAQACGQSPAREASVITVGATDRSDQLASFSNYGDCVDIFAPGVAVQTTVAEHDGALADVNGTSFSAPYVAGVVAMILENNPSATPADVRGQLLMSATADRLPFRGDGTPNLLLNNTLVTEGDFGLQANPEISTDGVFELLTETGDCLGTCLYQFMRIEQQTEGSSVWEVVRELNVVAEPSESDVPSTAVTEIISLAEPGSYRYRAYRESYSVPNCEESGCGAEVLSEEYSNVELVVVSLPPQTPIFTSVPAPLSVADSISWSESTGTDFYEVDVNYPNGDSQLLTFESNVFEVGNQFITLIPGIWDLRVRACNDSGCSAYSETASTNVEDVYPAGLIAPQFTVFPDPLSIINAITWSFVDAAESYELSIELPDGTAQSVTTTFNNYAVSDSFETLMPGQWVFSVRACNAQGCGAHSIRKTATVEVHPELPAPQFTAVPNPIVLTDQIWWNSVVGTEGYRVEVTLPNGTSELLRSNVIAITLSDHFENLEPGVWAFRVRACNTGGCGDFSEQAVTTVENPVDPLTTPENLTVPNPLQSSGDVIHWDPVSDETSYILSVRNNNGRFRVVYVGEEPLWVTQGLPTGVNEFRVRSCVGRDCGRTSAIVSAEVGGSETAPQIPDLTVPVPLIAGDVISWNGGLPDVVFELQMLPASGVFQTVYSGVETSWVFNEPVDGAVSFRIRACASGLCSEFSQEISTTVGVQDVDPTATPENLMVPNPLLSSGSLITWDQVTPQSTYILVVRNSEGRFRRIYEGPQTSWVTENLPLGLNEFRVRACLDNDCGVSTRIAAGEILQ